MTDFVRAHTVLAPVPLVPEIVMHTAAAAIPLWEQTEAARGETGGAPPFWAFPWPGGQALARYLFDHPATVAGRTVLDLAAGGGLVAIAAARCGAAAVTAIEIDPYADAAIALNAAANQVTVARILADALERSDLSAQVVLCGDVFYSREMSDRFLTFLRRAAGAGSEVLVGDPGRAYLPRDLLIPVARYDVPVNRDLEDAEVKPTVVWRWRGVGRPRGDRGPFPLR
jgi:predicted nicotinamide N-methyase